MNKWKQYLAEATKKSPKAIFMAGGPGSGKSTLLKQIGAFDEQTPVVNADDYFEPMLKAAGLSLDLDHPEKEIRSQQGKLFVQAQNAAKAQTRELVTKMSDVIIDGTAGSLQNVRKAKERLEDERGKMGGRKVKPERAEKSWRAVNKNKEAYKSLFGQHFFYFDGMAENKDTLINDIKRKYKSFMSS